jgi:hypothetical protein
MWTLETIVASFAPSLRLEIAWMMFLYHGKWKSGFETKRKGLFLWFWQINDDFAIKMLQTSFAKLKKRSPTNLYMLYPMMQSVVLVYVEIDKKMPPQWHWPWSSSKNIILLNYLNFKFVAKHLSVDCWRSQHPLHANKRPYLPRYRAPRHTHTYMNIRASRHWLLSKYFRQPYDVLPSCVCSTIHSRQNKRPNHKKREHSFIHSFIFIHQSRVNQPSNNLRWRK